MEIDYYYLNHNSYYRININDEILLVKNPYAVFYVKKIINKNINNFENINIAECIENITYKSNLISFFYEESFYNEQIVNLKDFSIENYNCKLSTINVPDSKIIYRDIKDYLLKIKKKHLFFKFNEKNNQLIIFLYNDDDDYKIVCNNVISYYYASESFRNELWQNKKKYVNSFCYKIDNIWEMKNTLFMSFVNNNYNKKVNLNADYREYLISDEIGEETISVICSPDIQINKLTY